MTQGNSSTTVSKSFAFTETVKLAALPLRPDVHGGQPDPVISTEGKSGATRAVAQFLGGRIGVCSDQTGRREGAGALWPTPIERFLLYAIPSSTRSTITPVDGSGTTRMLPSLRPTGMSVRKELSKTGFKTEITVVPNPRAWN
jgi:hypothetical protein